MRKIIKKYINELGFDIVKSGRNVKDTNKYIEHYGKESVQNRTFYNISAGGHFGFGGDFFHPCWTNIDVDLGDEIFPHFDPSKDIAYDPLDLNELPLEKATAEIVHSRFAIEHIPDPAALNLFKEVRRILKKDGLFRIIAPNSQLDYEAYLRNDRDFFWWEKAFEGDWIRNTLGYSVSLKEVSLQQLFLTHFAANASIIHLDGSENRISDSEFDEIFARNEFENAMNICTSRCSIEKHRKFRKNHINWWTYEKVRRFLLEVGFSKVLFVNPRQSLSPVIRRNPFFDRLWNDVALYVEAVK